MADDHVDAYFAVVPNDVTPFVFEVIGFSRAAPIHRCLKVRYPFQKFAVGLTPDDLSSFVHKCPHDR